MSIIVAIHYLMTHSVNSIERRTMFVNEIKKCEVLCANCHAEHHGKYNYLKSITEVL